METTPLPPPRPRPKPQRPNQNNPTREKDPILRALTNEYFRLARRENAPKTPDITADLETLEQAIRAIKSPKPS